MKKRQDSLLSVARSLDAKDENSGFLRLYEAHAVSQRAQNVRRKRTKEMSDGCPGISFFSLKEISLQCVVFNLTRHKQCFPVTKKRRKK